MNRNITVSLDEETLRAARVTAARRGLSVSALLRAALRRIAEREKGYARARGARRSSGWSEGLASGSARFPGARSCTTAMRFVDTNILVYAEQPGAGEKHARACRVLGELWRSGDGALSAQVLQEFFVTVTQKMPLPYTPEVAKRVLFNYLAWEVVALDGPLVLDAIATQEESRLS